MGVEMIKVELPVIGRNGVLDEPQLEWLANIYSALEITSDLGEVDKKFLDGLGEIIDYGKILTQMVCRANNPEAGMDYQEQQEIHTVVTKIKDAGVGGSIYLTDAEFAFVSSKVQARYAVKYNELFFNFIESILASQPVAMTEERIKGVSNA